MFLKGGRETLSCWSQVKLYMQEVLQAKRGNAPIRLLNQTAKDVSYLPGHKVVAAICEIDETNIHAIDSAQNVPTCAYLKPCTTESAISHTNSVHVNIKLKIFEKGLSETERSELLQFFEEKKSNTFRFALDYRKLNQITLSISHPLPRLECIFDTIGQADAKIFSTLDLASGFWQIPMILKLAIKQLLWPIIMYMNWQECHSV